MTGTLHQWNIIGLILSGTRQVTLECLSFTVRWKRDCNLIPIATLLANYYHYLYHAQQTDFLIIPWTYLQVPCSFTYTERNDRYSLKETDD